MAPSRSPFPSFGVIPGLRAWAAALPSAQLPELLELLTTPSHRRTLSAAPQDDLASGRPGSASEAGSSSHAPAPLAPAPAAPVAERNSQPDPVSGPTAATNAPGTGTSPIPADDSPAAPAQLCAELLPEAALGLDSTDPQWLSTPLLDPSLTFRLHSDPTATRLIYLDFNGHTTTGTGWNTSTMGSSFTSPAYDIDGNAASFSSAELTRIQQIWQRVASDFAPFDVDVTTQAPPSDWLIRSSSTDATYGIRVVVTSYGPYSSTAGGVSFVGSFTANSDTPAFVYNRTVIGAAEAISHEVGHTLGLSHDGKGTTTYYAGHGSGETSWAPIMGASYNRSVTTWDTGLYTGTNNGGSSANYGKGPDDLAVITGYNGFGYQPDLVGNSISTGSALRISGGQVNQFGTIETRQDQDVYSFQLLSTGDLNLSFDPYWSRAYVDGDGSWGGSSTAWATHVSDLYSSTTYVENGSNLDLLVTLTNASGKVIATSNPTGLAASLSVLGLAAGTYGLSLDGTGYGNPTAATPSGYTDADSLGYFRISGTISGAADTIGTLALATSDTTLLTADTTVHGGRDPITGSGHGKGSSALGPALGSDPLTGAALLAPVGSISAADDTSGVAVVPLAPSVVNGDHLLAPLGGQPQPPDLLATAPMPFGTGLPELAQEPWAMAPWGHQQPRLEAMAWLG